jgi:hypothetical protein
MENRNPKAESSPKSEIQRACLMPCLLLRDAFKPHAQSGSAWPARSRGDIRHSDFGLLSDFGFRHSDLPPRPTLFGLYPIGRFSGLNDTGANNVSGK